MTDDLEDTVSSDLQATVSGLIDDAKLVLDDRELVEVERLLGVGEFEMALEAIIIELTMSRVYPPNFDAEIWRTTAVSCGLDGDGIFRADIFHILGQWIDDYSE